MVAVDALDVELTNEIAVEAQHVSFQTRRRRRSLYASSDACERTHNVRRRSLAHSALYGGPDMHTDPAVDYEGKVWTTRPHVLLTVLAPCLLCLSAIYPA